MDLLDEDCFVGVSFDKVHRNQYLCGVRENPIISILSLQPKNPNEGGS